MINVSGETYLPLHLKGILMRVQHVEAWLHSWVWRPCSRRLPVAGWTQFSFDAAGCVWPLPSARAKSFLLSSTKRHQGSTCRPLSCRVSYLLSSSAYRWCSAAPWNQTGKASSTSGRTWPQSFGSTCRWSRLEGNRLEMSRWERKRPRSEIKHAI